jgi:hypothetical protein
LIAALQVEQGQVAKLEKQLALPSVDRALGRAARRLREMSDRFTGGGIRALAGRVLMSPLRRSLFFASRHLRLAAVPRAMLKPFPHLATFLYRVTAQPDPLVAESIVSDPAPNLPEIELPPSNDPVVAKLPASARATYLKLHSALSDEGDRPRVP